MNHAVKRKFRLAFYIVWKYAVFRELITWIRGYIIAATSGLFSTTLQANRGIMFSSCSTHSNSATLQALSTYVNDPTNDVTKGIILSWKVWRWQSTVSLPFAFCSLPVTWCTASLTLNNCTLCPHCIYVFCIYLRTNSDLCHLQHKLIGFYNRDEKCLQRGTYRVFK